jgi:hypothetical protein
MIIIYNTPIIVHIKKYLEKNGWDRELSFLNSVIGNIETFGDNYGFMNCLKNYDTLTMKGILENYKHLSIPHGYNDSKKNAHDNNFYAIDAAMANW